MDISAEGLGVVAALNIPAQTNCSVRLTLPMKPLGGATIDVHVFVTHSVFSTPENGFKLGLQFTNVSTTIAQAIAKFMQS